MFPRLRDYRVIGLDTETTGLYWWKDKIFGVSVSAPDGQDWYWDVRTHPGALDFLRDEIPRCQKIVAHNAKFDWHMTRESGIIFPEDRVDCTMIRAALIDEHLLTYDLDALGKKYIGVGKDGDIWADLAAIFGGKPTKSAQIVNLPRAPASLVARYAKQDSRTALGLWVWQEGEIEKQEIRTVCNLERDLMPVIVEMEFGGVKVNVEEAEKAVKVIDRQAKTAQYQLNNLAGFEINPNPSNSIKELFQPKKNDQGQWVLRDGTIAPPTEGGAPSINADVLRAMKDPAAAMILKLRKLLKTRDTFLLGHILGHHDNGVIHANYNQTKSDNDLGTGTGRLSVNDPALQQIHKRDVEIAEVVRALFEADDADSEWVCNDWAQMDFRVFAHYVKNPAILKMYQDDPDTDFHLLASKLTGLPRSARYAGDANAKQINLGLVFGMGQGTLAQEMGLPYTMEEGRDGRAWCKPGPEAEAVFEKYHAAIPGVKDLLKGASSVARSRGYVKTILGRRIRFPRGMFVHKAGGLIFQGSAADALKVKLIETHRYLKEQNCGARLVLNVHDEFDSNVPKGMDHIKAGISRIVTKFDGIDTPIKFRVPVRTDQGSGPNWWEACK
jgi:DNA polymerase-1